MHPYPAYIVRTVDLILIDLLLEHNKCQKARYFVHIFALFTKTRTRFTHPPFCMHVNLQLYFNISCLFHTKYSLITLITFIITKAKILHFAKYLLQRLFQGFLPTILSSQRVNPAVSRTRGFSGILPPCLLARTAPAAVGQLSGDVVRGLVVAGCTVRIAHLPICQKYVHIRQPILAHFWTILLSTH